MIKDMVESFDHNQGRPVPGAGAELVAEEEDDSALAKYSTDMVRLARDGKLDPVVGRDEEISRVV